MPEYPYTIQLKHDTHGSRFVLLWWLDTGQIYPDSKIHGANLGSTWGRQDPGGPHVGHMSLAIWVGMALRQTGWIWAMYPGNPKELTSL